MIPLLSSILPLILCQPQTQDIVLMPDALPVVGTSAVVSDSSVYQPMDKKEKDARITEMLLSAASQPIAPEFQPADPSSLILHKTDDEGILRTEGSIYMIDKISNDLYFSSQSGSVSPLWNPAFAIQSMSNLLLGQIPSPAFEIDLTHRCYGLEHPQLNISWAMLYHVICSPGSRTYASGLIQQDGETIRGVLVIHQPLGNYLHMLVLTTTRENLFAPEGQRKPLKGDLFTNIPQHNILNLYE